MPISPVNTAVILCGGMSTRMGDLTTKKPKSLLNVNGKPIIWYTINFLKQNGVKRFIFPLGYLGKKIKNYIQQEFKLWDAEFIFTDTGKQAEIHSRINKILKKIKPDDNFVLLNSDTIFSFDLTNMGEIHVKNCSDLTLATVPITSPWGIVIESDGKLASFQRDLKIDNVGLLDHPTGQGQIYSGLCIINSKVLTNFDWVNCYDFETDVFNNIIQENKAKLHRINGFWYPIDTPKHLASINQDFKIALRQPTKNQLSKISKGLFNAA